ncbi:hypothetical protein G6F32_016195 [Rhizopus arrhizus]|nr:hypothetical protein G6F32_016195 [Rhizopus arrhizus]
MAIERGAPGQVAGVDKRGLRACVLDAPGRVFPHALDQAQAQPAGGARGVGAGGVRAGAAAGAGVAVRQGFQG